MCTTPRPDGETQDPFHKHTCPHLMSRRRCGVRTRGKRLGRVPALAAVHEHACMPLVIIVCGGRAQDAARPTPKAGCQKTLDPPCTDLCTQNTPTSRAALQRSLGKDRVSSGLLIGVLPYACGSQAICTFHTIHIPHNCLWRSESQKSWSAFEGVWTLDHFRSMARAVRKWSSSRVGLG